MSGIQPRLSAFDAAMVVVSLVIGIGIFRTPAIVAAAAGTPGRFLAAWAVAGLITLLGALTFAEIGSRHPRAGGYYKVVADCYHPALAFMLNWAQALMQGVGAAGVAFIGVEYLLPLVVPAGRRSQELTVGAACALMLVLLVLNAAGIRSGARTQNLLSLSKIAMIAALAVAAFALAPAAPAAPAPFAAPGKGFLAALIPCFYAYGGYQMTMNLGADVVDARRKLPLAVAGGMGVVIALYLAINLAYQNALGVAGVAESKLVAAALAEASLGPLGETVVSLLIFLSAAGFVNATVLQVPRTFYAMAEDGVLPPAFLKVNEKTQVQGLGLAFFGLTMLVPAFLLGTFESLLTYVMFTDSLTLVVVASTLFVLRRRAAGEGAAFRMPGYPLLPGLFALCLLGVSVQILLTETRLTAMGVLVFLTGAPLYLLGRRLWGNA